MTCSLGIECYVAPGTGPEFVTAEQVQIIKVAVQAKSHAADPGHMQQQSSSRIAI